MWFILHLPCPSQHWGDPAPPAPQTNAPCRVTRAPAIPGKDDSISMQASANAKSFCLEDAKATLTTLLLLRSVREHVRPHPKNVNAEFVNDMIELTHSALYRVTRPPFILLCMKNMSRICSYNKK